MLIGLDVFEAIQVRKSVRAYDSKPIPKEILMKILEAGRISPSAANWQPWHFIVVTDPEKREILSKWIWTRFLRESPVVIVGCGDKKRSPEFHVIDVSIALQSMVLMATAEGIGTCWVGGFKEDVVRELCKIPENFEVVCLIAMGYPREKFSLSRIIAGGKRRKAISEVVSFDEFGKKDA